MSTIVLHEIRYTGSTVVVEEVDLQPSQIARFKQAQDSFPGSKAFVWYIGETKPVAVQESPQEIRSLLHRWECPDLAESTDRRELSIRVPNQLEASRPLMPAQMQAVHLQAPLLSSGFLHEPSSSAQAPASKSFHPSDDTRVFTPSLTGTYCPELDYGQGKTVVISGMRFDTEIEVLDYIDALRSKRPAILGGKAIVVPS